MGSDMYSHEMMPWDWRQQREKEIAEVKALMVLAATLLCELGRVSDPRIEAWALRRVDLEDAATRPPQAFRADASVDRSLTLDEAIIVLDVYKRQQEGKS